MPTDDTSGATSIDVRLPYEQLRDGDLRLLTVHPFLSSSTDDLIHCTLEKLSLKDIHPDFRSSKDPRYIWGDYFAVSYCWGWDATKPSKRVVINGHIIKVTESLEAALRCMRSLRDLADYPWLKFWVDAICINQEDGKEIKREILRMRDIYGESARVFVHLGPETEDSALGVAYLRRTAAQIASGADCAKALLAVRTSASEELRDEIRATIKLICRPYWHRVWILQELAMGKGSDTYVGWGQQMMDFKDIVHVSKLFSLNGDTLFHMIGTGLEIEFTMLMTSMWVALWTAEERNRRQRTKSSTKAITYLDLRQPLLTLAQNAKATNPHDNIYGILGLMPDAIRNQMEPYINYELPVNTVFTAFSRVIIEATGDLDIIFAKRFSQTMTPSWATDWTLPSDRAGHPHDWFLYCYDQFDGAYENLAEVIDASRQSRADSGRKSRLQPMETPESVLLRCEGFKIGAIDGMAAYMPDIDSQEGHPDPTFIQSTCLNSPYGGEPATSRALIHTLFGNPIWGDLGGPALFHIPWLLDEASPLHNVDGSFFIDENINGHLDQLRQHGWDAVLGNNFIVFEWWRRRMGHFIIGGKRFMDYFNKDIVPCTFPDQRIKLDMATVLGGSKGRRLVTLSTGHFGLAPRTIQPGDDVYVILGCSLPIVLRPTPETKQYEVIGECYVEGYARGEALEGLDRGEFQLQDIILT